MPEFRNPNAGTGAGGGAQDNRSFMLMLLVMVGVLFGLQYWRAKHNPQTAAPDAPSAVSAPATPNPGVGNTAVAGSPALSVAPANQGNQAVQASSETTTVVENELYRITFSNRGGEVTSWILKRFKEADQKTPLDLVHDGAAKLYGYPMSLYTYDGNLTRALNGALYVGSGSGSLQAPGSLTYTYAAGNLKVTKTFSFSDDYSVHADVQVLRDGVPIAAALAWPAGLGDMENAQAYANATVDTMSNGKDDHTAFKKVIGGATLSGPFDWAGTADQYFAAVFLPDRPNDATLITLHNQIDINKVQRRVGQGAPGKGTLLVPVIGDATGDRTNHVQTRLFVGPKRIPVLKAVISTSGHSLEPLLDFGFWGPVGKVLFLGLQFVHAHIVSSWIGSWGWAIVLFTIAINLILLPLRVQSMRSALKMQRIQPQLDAIKAKYKNPKPTDPKTAEMNQEIMAYQKEQGVSMFGGCVPTLIQLPLLFAFFTMMTRVVELRQAHFLWLPDLSSADPYHILPIVMVLTSFAVQFFTPSPGVDPQQQKMMAFMMPAFSGYMTWNYASGLALYWNIGNVIMIIQQAVMNRTSLGREMRAMQLQRAKRKAGPTTIQARR